VIGVKLSELEQGKTYSIQADGVDTSFFVVKAGICPLVMMQDMHNPARKEFDPDSEVFRIIQLMGWLVFEGSSLSHMDSPGFFVLDESLESSWLVGVYQGNEGEFTMERLACTPHIALVN
jgi:hypothetical protein